MKEDEIGRTCGMHGLITVLVTDKHGNEHSVSVVYNPYLDQLCD